MREKTSEVSCFLSEYRRGLTWDGPSKRRPVVRVGFGESPVCEGSFCTSTGCLWGISGVL